MKNAVSDSYLLSLWRKAVRIRWEYTCAICGRTHFELSLEAHHIYHRRYRLLRWDFRNGVLVCPGECHKFVDTPAGQKLLGDRVPWEYLRILARKTLKEHINGLGITRNEFMLEKKQELLKYIDMK